MFHLQQASWGEAINELRSILSVRFPLEDQTFTVTADPSSSNKRADFDLRDTTARTAINAIVEKFGGTTNVTPFAVHFSPPPAPPSKSAAAEDLPYGTPVPGKPGFATSPHAPFAGYVDLRGFPAGTEVKCPYTSKPFLVP